MKNMGGRCISCGLLTKRTAPDHSGLSYYEVRPEEREHGYLFLWPGPDPTNPGIRCTPGCYAGAVPLAQEIMGEVPQRSSDNRWDQDRAEWQQRCLGALLKDRQCPSWVEYIEGLSPEWHLEMHQMNVLQKAREEWELHMEQERRGWQQEFQRQASKFGNRLALAAAILGGLQVVAAIIGLTPESWFVKFLSSWFSGSSSPHP
jgi:hypothetical protein